MQLIVLYTFEAPSLATSCVLFRTRHATDFVDPMRNAHPGLPHLSWYKRRLVKAKDTPKPFRLLFDYGFSLR